MKANKIVCLFLSCFLISFFQKSFPISKSPSKENEVSHFDKNLDQFKNEFSRNKKDGDSGVGVYEVDELPGSDATLIPNAFYFQKLGRNHGFNTDYICTIVAAQILFGYYDTFVNDYLVDDTYDLISIDQTGVQSVQNFAQSPGTGFYGEYVNDQRFTDYLVDLATDENVVSPHINGYDTHQQKKFIKRYLDESGFSYNLYAITNGSPLNLTKLRIKQAINNGRPIICNSRDHSAVAYGYDDDYVYVHTGWGCVGRTVWATFEDNSNVGYEIGAIDIVLSCEHIHSDNYYSSYYHKAYCPDGFERGRMELKPNDFGFEPQYYFYQKLKNIYVGDDTIQTRRLRTGYIENSFVNLSPRRQDAGIAYLEMTFPSIIRNIVIDISFWGGNELYDPNIHNARIEYKDSDNHWVEAIDLLHDISLSTNRFNQDRINIVFPEETSSFRFYASNYAIGNLNKGRISIGGLSITYE